MSALLSLQILLFARDRPNVLREAPTSASVQAGPYIDVIVTGNSERNEVVRMLACEFPQVLCTCDDTSDAVALFACQTGPVGTAITATRCLSFHAC